MVRLVDILAAGVTDSSGTLLDSGTVTVYDAGTTTLKTVYEDFAQTTPHSNPLTLDGAGRAYAYAEGRIKIVIMDSDGNTVKTLDNVGNEDDDVSISTSTMPVGSVLDYAGSTAPSGYLLCYGQAISRNTYSDLFGVVGTTYGSGDGSTTFNVPDLRGRVGVGKDDMGGSAADRVAADDAHTVDGASLGATGGVSEHQLTVAETAAHDHDTNTGTESANHYHQTVYNDSAGAGSAEPTAANSMYRRKDWGSDFSFDLNSDGEIANISRTSNENTTHTHAITSEGGDTAHTNLQPSLVLNKIIKY